MNHLVGLWRKNRLRDGLMRRPRSNRARPKWVRKRRQSRCSTGLHLFTREFRNQKAPAAVGRRHGNQGWTMIARAHRALLFLSSNVKLGER